MGNLELLLLAALSLAKADEANAHGNEDEAHQYLDSTTGISRTHSGSDARGTPAAMMKPRVRAERRGPSEGRFRTVTVVFCPNLATRFSALHHSHSSKPL